MGIFPETLIDPIRINQASFIIYYHSRGNDTADRVTLVCYTAVFSVVTQRSSPQGGREGGALRDNTKNGCVAD